MPAADRGFASMDQDKRRAIARKGGQAAHAVGTAHEWTVEEARVAGRKGRMARRKHEAPAGNASVSTATGQLIARV
jgi:general stress protein YciG